VVNTTTLESTVTTPLTKQAKTNSVTSVLEGSRMPKRNAPGDVYAERYLAQRIARLREAKGMSYDGLASRMTQAGCPLNQSAIYKIERGDPPRRITVDELVAYSRVFGIPVEQLLIDPELDVDQEIVDALDEVRTYAAARANAEDRLIDAVERVRDMAEGSARAKRTLQDYLERTVVPGDYFKVLSALANTKGTKNG